jgi:hypothetical protein
VTTETRAVVLRVRASLKRGILRSGLLILLIVPLPIFVSFALLDTRTGPWPFAAGEALCLALASLGVGLFRRVCIGVTATTIEERGFWGRLNSLPLSDVGSIVVARTYAGSSAETHPQLLVRDRAGKRMLRMRGIFWPEQSMRAVAESLGERVHYIDEPMTSAEFLARYPGTAYWFENRPGIAIATLATLVIVCVAAVLGLMKLLGLPINR